MIIASPSEIAKTGFGEDDVKPELGSPGLLPPPPPTHPSVQYGGRSSPVPPTYVTTRPRPATSIVYTFRPSMTPDYQSSSMVLYAPRDACGARDPYHISVNLNCFTPSSVITTVKRGSLEGETVGDFEMGPSNAKISNTVCISGNEHPIEDVLVSSNNFFKRSWSWKTIQKSDRSNLGTLLWDSSDAGGGVLNCFSSKEHVQVNLMAKFIPRSHLRRQGRPNEYAKLEITPLGNDYFDDILISALIIERMRTVPGVV